MCHSSVVAVTGEASKKLYLLSFFTYLDENKINEGMFNHLCHCHSAVDLETEGVMKDTQQINMSVATLLGLCVEKTLILLIFSHKFN